MAGNKTVKRPNLSKEGFFGQSKYFIRRAFLNIKQNLLINLLTVGTISLSILIFSLFLLLYINLEKVTELWSEKVQVTAFFENELSSEQQQQIKSGISSIKGTGRISYVSKNEALKRFRERLQGQDILLEEVSAEILPSSFEIELKKEYRTDEYLQAYITQLRNVPGISEIQFGEDWVRRFNNLLYFMRILGLFVGSFLVLAVVFIVANTIKLTVCSRKDELELLALVGGTRLFIKTPFLIEGVIQGAAGALVAIVTLFGVYYGFLQNAGEFFGFNSLERTLVFLPASYLAAILAGGIFLGFVGSLASLKRFSPV